MPGQRKRTRVGDAFRRTKIDADGTLVDLLSHFGDDGGVKRTVGEGEWARGRGCCGGRAVKKGRGKFARKTLIPSVLASPVWVSRRCGGDSYLGVIALCRWSFAVYSVAVPAFGSPNARPVPNVIYMLFAAHLCPFRCPAPATRHRRGIQSECPWAAAGCFGQSNRCHRAAPACRCPSTCSAD